MCRELESGLVEEAEWPEALVRDGHPWRAGTKRIDHLHRPHTFSAWGTGIMAEDVVCNRQLTPYSTGYSSQYHGQTFIFCSLECKERFDFEPEDYAPLGQSHTVSTEVLLRAAS